MRFNVHSCLRLFLAAVLAVAAGVKIYHQGAQPLLPNPLLPWRWLQIGAIELELLVAFLLAFKPFAARTGPIAFVFFGQLATAQRACCLPAASRP